jgi:hypothetical protein
MDQNGDVAKRVLEIKRSVMSYLIRQPDAKDTAAGILQWWLPGALRKARTAEELLLALVELLESGWITTSSFGGTKVYGLNCSRRDEIQRWLES